MATKGRKIKPLFPERKSEHEYTTKDKSLQGEKCIMFAGAAIRYHLKATQSAVLMRRLKKES